MALVQSPSESEALWEEHRSIITQLYVNERRTLGDVMNIMEREYSFKSSRKVYKRRLLKWGCRKYIRLRNHEEHFVAEKLWATSSSRSASSEHVVLPDGLTVSVIRLASHLRRRKPCNHYQKHAGNFCPVKPGLSALRPPDIYHILEALYSGTRSYLLGRFSETVRTPEDFDKAREPDPHAARWLSFSNKIRETVVNRRFDDAVVCMREAPHEFKLLLQHQPGSILSNLFRFLTSISPSMSRGDAEAQQFLKVLQSLFRYGATCLGSAMESAYGQSSEHPLRRVLESLAKVDGEYMHAVSSRAWQISCQAGYDLMEAPTAVRANIDWLVFATEGGGSISDLPKDFDSILQRTLQYYNGEDKGHLRQATTIVRVAYHQMIVEAQGRDPLLDPSIYQAALEAKKERWSMNEAQSMRLLQQFGIPCTQPRQNIKSLNEGRDFFHVSGQSSTKSSTQFDDPFRCENCGPRGFEWVVAATYRENSGALDLPELFPIIARLLPIHGKPACPGCHSTTDSELGLMQFYSIQREGGC